MGEKELRIIREKCQKKPDSILGVIYYRKISVYITYLLSKTNITPNHITFFSFLFALTSGIFFSTGRYSYLVAGAILLQLRVYFDCSDGEIAKLKRLSSDRGAILDEVLDRYGDFIVFVSIGFGLTSGNITTSMIYRHLDLTWPLVLSCTVGIFMSSIIAFKSKTLNMQSKWRDIEKGIGKSKYAICWCGGLNEFLISVFAVLNRIDIAIAMIAVGSNLNWVGQLYFLLIKKDT